MSKSRYTSAVKAGKHLYKAAKSMRVLRSVAWNPAMKTAFLKRGKLPDPTYEAMPTDKAREHVKDARALIDAGDDLMSGWLCRLSDSMMSTVNMIETRGTPEFFSHSTALYGQPTRLMLDRKTMVLDLAKHMDSSLEGLDFDRLVVEGTEKHLTDTQFARALRKKLDRHFETDAPNVIISPTVSAKAAATSKRIRIRQGASFTARDVEQLLHHEALVHTATALNGRSQKKFPILGWSHPGTTEVQEGLAVFAELVTGSMDPRRFRRLSGRVLGIQMAVDGADFKDVFDFFLERTDSPDQSYENARRVFRGGVIAGGAPFTKDMVYLNGLLRVHNFMRTVVKMGRSDLIRMLFVGKLDIEDVPALSQMAVDGMIESPKFMPPWVNDLRFLVSYMAYSGFLNRVEMPGFQEYYQEELKEVPDVWSLVRHDRIDETGEDIIAE
ncbi:flavohemoglobin expression-modulating QEGLA motif protein [uncultured Algimonas sp.]|uniref:flavohemoglobin expression-modulating QEGLA motif protein n=1 Tax=uncultured Algimonas sp. TaxID=1547920 RepID=UPI00260D4C5B|nr:flavohemoglobin expression-modulating QEGLA motif protein [uncultured Algimonas sp.]